MFNILNIIEICNRKEPDRDDYMKCADWKSVNRTLYTISMVLEILQSVGKVPEQQSFIRHPAV